jgi:hypothetical protein
MQIQQMRQHRNADDRQRECERDPELRPYFADLLVVLLLDRHLRLERHAADRTVAWTELAHLRVHRTCIDRGGSNVGIRLPRGHSVMVTMVVVMCRHVLRWIARKLRSATSRAEYVSLSVVGNRVRRVVAYLHSAHWID